MKEPNFKSASDLPPEQADIRRQQETAKAIDAAVPSWLKGGRLINVAMVDANELQVSHGLGRKPKGWFMGSVSGDADVHAVVQTASNERTVDLQNQGASGTLKFVLWVY